jgi:hypothetical protein
MQAEEADELVARLIQEEEDGEEEDALLVARLQAEEEDALLVARLQAEEEDALLAALLQAENDLSDSEMEIWSQPDPADTDPVEIPATSSADVADTMCVVCMTEAINAKIVPCNHRSMCMHCASEVRDRLQSRCPICRGCFTQIIEE